MSRCRISHRPEKSPYRALLARRWKTAVRCSWHSVLDVFFPPSCPGCKREIEPPAQFARRVDFCSFCLEELAPYDEPVCRRCGCEVSGQSAGGCQHCHGSKFRFDETMALGSYCGLLRELLLRMKHTSAAQLSLAMGELLWTHCGDRLTAVKADCVAPIPMFWLRRLRRSTDSAALVAEVLARRLGTPLAGRLLRRRRNTLPQSGLLPLHRKQNLEGALAVRRGYALQGARVLLVDDIMTTGATCNAAARILKAAGAKSVAVAVVARSVG